MPYKQFISKIAPLKSFRIKVVASVLLLLVFWIAVALKLAIDFQTRQIMRLTDRESQYLVHSVETSLINCMLGENARQVTDVLSALGKNEKVNGVYLSDYNGNIKISTRPDMVGEKSLRLAAIPAGAESHGEIIYGSRTGLPAKAIYSRTFRIDNQTGCMACHHEAGPVLGWLTVDMSIDDVMDELEQTKTTMVMGAGLIGLLLSVSLTLFLTRSINRPLEKLASAMKMAEDDLDVSVDTETDNELRVLSDGFNSLLSRLKVSRDELVESHRSEIGTYSTRLEKAGISLDEKVRKLATLIEVGRQLNVCHKIDDLLKLILDSSIMELDGDNGSIMLFEKNLGELKISRGVGLLPESHRRNRFRLGEGIAGWVAENKESLIVHNVSEDPRYVSGNNSKDGFALLSVPFISTKSEVLGVMNIERGYGRTKFSDEDLMYLSAIAGQASVAIENVELFVNLHKSYYDTISALAMTVEAKDPYTLGHSKRVTQYSMAIAEEMGFSDEEILQIQYGATLHDIGKIGVCENVLNKPGSLNDAEFKEIMCHSAIGDNIIADVDFLQPIRPIVRSHQERHDGSGYPDGLKGDEIPLAVAIVSVADNYDALTTDRPYRKAFSHAQAIRMIREDSGTKLNPKAVEAFLRIFDDPSE